MRTTKQTSRAKAVILMGLALASLTPGCADLANTGEPMWAWRKPELLYLLAKPCDRLYVEVDTIEGLQPPAESLARLKEVLREYCDKPAGIRVVCGKPIPLERARGKPPRLLALENIDGPPASESAGRTAYLYVLFYDSKRMGLQEVENPHVDRYSPCAIHIDLAYWPPITRHLQREILTHELGHVLGVCKGTAHGDGLHCHNANCVMGPLLRVPLQTWLLGLAPPACRRRRFCRQCRQDLHNAQTQSPDPRLSFRGPVLVRREKGYYVGFLPACVRLCFRPNGELNWEQLRTESRRLRRKHADRLHGEARFIYIRDDATAVQGKRLAVARAAGDRNPAVGEIAAGLLEQLTLHVGSSSPPASLAAGRTTSAQTVTPGGAKLEYSPAHVPSRQEKPRRR